MERGPFTNNYLPGNKKMLVRFSLIFSVDGPSRLRGPFVSTLTPMSNFATTNPSKPKPSVCDLDANFITGDHTFRATGTTALSKE
jgi:hypothetical protein